MDKETHSLEEFEAEATRFAHTLAPATAGATLVTLSGELGAGKTAFTKVIAKTFGVTEIVNSPTFVLEKIYTLTDAPFSKLIHIDAYRLESGAELEPLELNDLMQDKNNLILLEWPEKVAEALPKATHTISIVAHDDGSRTLTYG